MRIGLFPLIPVVWRAPGSRCPLRGNKLEVFAFRACNGYADGRPVKIRIKDQKELTGIGWKRRGDH